MPSPATVSATTCATSRSSPNKGVSITGTVIYDSSWPVVQVGGAAEAFMVSEDLAAYEAGDITAATFEAFWGIHPLANFTVAFGTD